jgi:hypothetical protein
MKVRLGFVSNSSSSSFILAVKGNIKVELAKLFKDFPLKNFVTSLQYICTNKNNGKIKNFSDLKIYAEKQCMDEDDEQYLQIVDYLKDGYTVYNGIFSDDSGDALESYLCNEDINIDTPNLKLISAGGY